MNHQKQHGRSSSYGRKMQMVPAHAPSSKVKPLLRRGHSHNVTLSHGAFPGGRPTLGASKKVCTEVVVQQDAEDDEEMAGFLQFCATCEKQIVMPGTNILYCSEACRRTDTVLSTASRAPKYPPMMHSASSFDLHAPDIVPQRSPTMARPLSLTFSDLSCDEAARFSSEDDESTDMQDQEAARYSTHCRFGSWTHNQYLQSPESPCVSGAPSLSHTPSSSMASMSSMVAPRALPSRHNKSYSAYSIASVDLVTPCPVPIPSSPRSLKVSAATQSSVSTLTAAHSIEDTAPLYSRQPARCESSAAQSSLMQLFRHDAVRAPPSVERRLLSGVETMD